MSKSNDTEYISSLYQSNLLLLLFSNFRYNSLFFEGIVTQLSNLYLICEILKQQWVDSINPLENYSLLSNSDFLKCRK